jgi:hypothetical protein
MVLIFVSLANWALTKINLEPLLALRLLVVRMPVLLACGPRSPARSAHLQIKLVSVLALNVRPDNSTGKQAVKIALYAHWDI